MWGEGKVCGRGSARGNGRRYFYPLVLLAPLMERGKGPAPKKARNAQKATEAGK